MKQHPCFALLGERSRYMWVAIFTIVSIGIAPKVDAQTYPNRNIKYVVPSAAGSGIDLIGRMVAPTMGKVLGQKIVIEDQPNAHGMVAASDVAKSAPNGYTIMEQTSTLVGAFSVMKKNLPYHPINDFAPITRFVTGGLLLVVRPDFPAHNLKEFLAYAKAHPGKLTGGYATGSTQMSLKLLESLGGIKCVEVPYKGTRQALNDLLGGHLSFAFADYPNGFAQIRGGKLRGLAVTTPKRTPEAPDIPALAEQFPDFDVTIWSGLVAPAGTPRPIINKLYKAAKQAITRPPVKSRLSKISITVAPQTPDAFGKFLRDEVATWKRQAKVAGIKQQ